MNKSGSKRSPVHHVGYKGIETKNLKRIPLFIILNFCFKFKLTKPGSKVSAKCISFTKLVQL